MSEGHLTETQIGAVCENIIANALVASSNGRLSPFQPYADDGGVDLLILDKVTRGTMACQVKGRRNTVRRSPKVCHFEVRKATSDPRNYLLAALLDWPSQAIECAWLIPMSVMDRNLRSSGKYVIRPSTDPESGDRLSPFQHQSMQSLAERIIEILEGGAGA